MATNDETMGLVEVSDASRDEQARKTEALLAALDHGVASGRADAGVFARVRAGAPAKGSRASR